MFSCSEDYYDTPPDLNSLDEIEIYLGEPVLRCPDLLAWWRSNKVRLLKLAEMAFDYLTILAMSDEAERVFSASKLLYGINRQNL